MSKSYYEKQRREKELEERNEQRIRQFLLDRYNERYQEIEITGRHAPKSQISKLSRGEPWRHGVFEFVTCFHPENPIKSCGIPIEIYGFLCLYVGEAKTIQFDSAKHYEEHKQIWGIETRPKENLEAYLLRKDILMGTDFMI